MNSTNLEDNFKFQVNLDGIISLFSEHLYSNPGVFIREVLQNAIDAITMHQKVNSDVQGKINFELFNNTTGGTLVIEDNGIGLSLEDIHKFLSVIGQSSKRDTSCLTDDSFIGRFGIGLLSCFIVSDEITIITRKADSSETYQWIGKNDGTYSIKKITDSAQIGTTIYLKSKDGFEEFFTADYIKNTLKYYGTFLPFEVYIIYEGNSTLINDLPVPWEKEIFSRDYWLLMGKDVFNQNFIDCIPITSKTGGIKGGAFIIPYNVSMASKSKGKVYVKNMFVTENTDRLMPSWAFFLKPIINAQNLRLTASREDFYEDKNLEKVRDEISSSIKNYFYSLSTNNIDKLKEIISVHYNSLKLMAVDDDELFSVIINYIPFETSTGKKTLLSIFKEYKYLYYTSTINEFRQIEKTSKAQNICVINGGYLNDSELIEKFYNFLPPDSTVKRVTPEDITEQFEDLSISEMNKAYDFLNIADEVLKNEACTANIKKFYPVEIPVIYNLSEEAKFLKDIRNVKEEASGNNNPLFGEIASIFAQEVTESYASLCFNFNNPLIKKLINFENTALKQTVINILYVQALMLGQYNVKKREVEMFTSGINLLINNTLSGGIE